MLAHRFSVFAVLVAALGLGTGCGPSSGFQGSGGGGDQDGTRQLAIVGDAFRSIEAGELLAISVRYTEADGTVIPAGLVSFEVEGEAGGAFLAARVVETNVEGVATVNLITGNPTQLRVVATAEGVPVPAVMTVDVVVPSYGTLNAFVRYGGSRAVRTVEVGVFPRYTCAQVNRRAPAAALAESGRPGNTFTFERVERDVPVAVFALGIDRYDFVAAETCADVVLDGDEATVTISLQDTSEIPEGTYDVVETFDVTDGFNSTLDTILDAMTGLSSDPALYLVETVAEAEGSPDWLQDALDSSVVRTLVAALLRDALSGIHVPSYMTDIVDLGANVDGAFAEVTLLGELRLNDLNEFSTYDAVHSITTVAVPVGDEIIERPVRESAEIAATLEEELGMPLHTLDIAFGTVAEVVLEQILLPALPGEPHSMRELASQLFDCEAIAEWLAEEGSTWNSLANAVCDAGVVILAEIVEDSIMDLMEYDQLSLEGTASLTDEDRDYDRETLSEGQLQALWTGPSGELAFDGTMTGLLEDDTRGYDHPVRESLRAVLY